MFIIPKELMSILTFPGIIIHEWAHKLACDLFKIKVLETKYWSLQGGYVVHEATEDIKVVAAISLAPFVIGSLMAILLGIVCVIMRNWEILLEYFYVVRIFGITIGMHAFPSNQDTSNFLNFAKHYNKKTLVMIASTLHSVFIILNALRFIWIDAFYGAFLVILPEKIIFGSIV
ncbi:MAG: metalloprotease family protein [Holosporaceae bacterium]|jgi:hypothetical protein|nr:metalloprotease family protein [Holosporaceae bacterium]